MIVRWESEHDYVLVHLHQDMFGDWIYSRAWGQIGTQYGGLKHAVADSYDQAMMWIDDLSHIQTARGYRKVLDAEDDTPEGRQAMAQLSLLD
ncbi:MULTISPECIES: WGR domain-containing protein [Salinicola]|uniref:WGR domain-containing protein n=1 Tax=Salinicola socius TaxID=404433 RepID=A0A1Q8SSD2_9GAMM|nr:MULTISPECIES: WGR domain-containing protein [Salinicola]OLO04327.1 hypothetical protein BTW07_09200 [Salinicola socius]